MTVATGEFNDAQRFEIFRRVWRRTVKSNDEKYMESETRAARTPTVIVYGVGRFGKVSAADVITTYVHENSRRKCVFIWELCRVRIKENSDE